MRAATVVLLALAIWDFNDASGPYSVPDATVFLVIVSSMMALGLLRGGSNWAAIPKVPLFLSGACLIFGTLMTPLRLDFYQQYVLADAGTMVLFVLCLLVASKYYERLFNDRTVLWFTAIYSVIAVFAYIAATLNLRPSYWWHGRWDPPYFMLFGALGLLLRFRRKSAAHAAVYLGLLVAMSGLALYSGNRTQFALGALFVALAWASDLRALCCILFGLILVLLSSALGVVRVDIVGSLFADTRFGLLDGGVDESLLGRLREANDVWYHITSLNSPLQTFFGRGFGATWQQITSYARENVIDGGRAVHYLHIGLVNLGYRYGVFGAGLFLYWMWVVAANVRILFTTSSTIADRFWYLGGLGFALNFFFQNSLYDPPAVIAMAALLVLVKRRADIRRESPKVLQKEGHFGARWSALPR